MGKKFMGYNNASELITAIGNKIKAKYTKPSGGIPKSDLATAVQTSLEKADSALQSETDPTVPSWAKQLNKPSYTQDEVADGSTYKRVSQTEKSAWNGKQNALTTTQMQAVNSGITSEKVGRISTNQTNILSVKDMVCDDAFSTSKSYAVGDITIYDNKLYKFKNAHQGAWSASDVDQISLSEQNSDFVVAENNIKYAINNGVKNQLKLTGDVYNPNTLFAYWDYTNGTIRVVGSSATSATVFIYLGSWTAPEDNVYRLYANGLACTANIRIYDDASWTTYAATSSESNEATWTKGTTRQLYLRIASNVVVGDITVTPMICPKSVFDADSSFVPYGAPNSDLSALEAEDRAGLVECVDGGVKNIIDVNNYSNLDNVTISNGVFTTQGDTLTTLRFDVYLRNGSTQLLKAVNAQVISSNGVYQWEFVAPANTNNILIGHNGGTYNGRATINLTNLVAGQRYVIQVNVTQCQNASGAFKWQDVMICTKAAFCVSSKFVPYCKPLTSKMDHTYSLGSSIDLNTILRDGSYMCNPSANSPVSGLCFLKVTNDGSTDLQQTLQKLNNPETIYIRHRRYQSSSPYYSWTSWFAFTGTVVS